MVNDGYPVQDQRRNQAGSIANNPISLINKEFSSTECSRLLQKVDELREILQEEKYILPHIIVVGEQSVGKSSILEAISGIELPRAQNICTRCPLEMRLKTIDPNSAEYATIRCEGVQEKRLNIHGISEAVISCTNTLTGNTTDISSKPIFLTVYKHGIQHDLTLIDLPGITRARTGDQKASIYTEIRTLIENCIKHDTVIVVHVIPSSEDFTRSETIQMCQKYDPNCSRQIIAVSKIDKFDKGIAEKLQGVGSGSLALPLGCVAVLNRSQDEIDNNVSFAEMRQRENNFFATNSAFNSVPEEFLGSRSLIKKLVTLQQEKVREALPIFIEKVGQKVIQAKDELSRLPKPVKNEFEANTVLYEILREFRIAIEERLRGEYEIKHETSNSAWSPNSQNSWDDRIGYHLKMGIKYTSGEIEKVFSALSNINEKRKIHESIENNYGGGLPNFPSTNIIQQLYKPFYKEIEGPCKSFGVFVRKYTTVCLKYILNGVIPAEAPFKDTLMREMGKIIENVIQKSEENFMKNIDQLLIMEEKVFTLNPYYMETFTKQRGTLKNSSNPGTDDLILGLQCYCKVVLARVIDNIFQLCDYWYIHNGMLSLDKQIEELLARPQLFQWMKEPNNVEHKRKTLVKKIEIYQRALEVAQSS